MTRIVPFGENEPIPLQVGCQVRRIRRIRLRVETERLNEILARHTGQSFDRIRADTDREKFLTPVQAKQYGLIDEILARKSALSAVPKL